MPQSTVVPPPQASSRRGKPCYDCEGDVPMTRVRVIEDEAIAAGRMPVIRCRGCENRVPQRRRSAA